METTAARRPTVPAGPNVRVALLLQDLDGLMTWFGMLGRYLGHCCACVVYECLAMPSLMRGLALIVVGFVDGRLAQEDVVKARRPESAARNGYRWRVRSRRRQARPQLHLQSPSETSYIGLALSLVALSDM